MIVLGLAGMLACFPFIGGDPAPGQDSVDPAWFSPAMTVLTSLVGLGVLLVLAVPVRRLILDRQGRG